MLTVCTAAYSLESMTFDYALEAFALGGSHNIDEHSFGENVRNRKLVAEFEILCKVSLELDKFLLRRNTCLVKVTFKCLGGVLFFLFVIGKLHCGITVCFHCAQLRNNARTSLNNGAWNIFSIGTENGSHSDFLSN